MTAPQVVLTDPARVQSPRDLSCPRCGASEDMRVKSAGFGVPHDVCRKCGHEWSVEDSL